MVGNRSAVIGAALMALLAIFDLISIFAGGPPAVVFVIDLLLAIAVLVGLGLWATGRSPRLSMLTAVGALVVIALLGIPPMVAPDPDTPPAWIFALFIVLTIVAVILVRGELSRQTGQGSSSARIA